MSGVVRANVMTSEDAVFDECSDNGKAGKLIPKPQQLHTASLKKTVLPHVRYMIKPWRKSLNGAHFCAYCLSRYKLSQPYRSTIIYILLNRYALARTNSRFASDIPLFCFRPIVSFAQLSAQVFFIGRELWTVTQKYGYYNMHKGLDIYRRCIDISRLFAGLKIGISAPDQRLIWLQNWLGFWLGMVCSTTRSTCRGCA